MACPVCGIEIAAGAKFCSECGAALSAQEPLSPAQERKVVSVLFCDLVGFTASSEAADPEDVRARLRPYHERLRRELKSYGGTVEKFVGDAVMAVFGAPVAHEDDAERAVRAGLRILEAISELNDADPALGLQVRVGVNTGEAVVEVSARPEVGEGIVTGDVVNTASRLQSVAPTDAVVVSEATFWATERIFDYERLEPASVKGKSEPLAMFRPLRPRARFGSDVTRTHTTPLVGRELEKPLLVGVFERAAKQRSCQLVTIVGEPGVGKSRLCMELFQHVQDRPELTRWRQGRCLPYGEGIAFWALGEIVKAEAGILESDSADVAAAKLAEALLPEEAEPQWLLQRLRPLVGLEASAATERQELFVAWRRFLEGLAAGRPTVLVFEDLHWADEALIAFLEYLVEWSQGVPLLVLCAARPELYERRPGWGAGQRNAQTINLSPLSDEETAELVSHLITTTLPRPELEQVIVKRAGGNPLYAEEFVRLLADRAFSPGDDALPDSVQALIAARLDTLSAERKSLLHDAAILGKVFWAGGVAEIGGRNLDEVGLALHELARKELIRPTRTSSMEGESEYAFWHLLVRDVAYSQIPRAERIRRHRAAAEWIERKAGERVEDMAEVLAYHYQQALELANAVGDAELAAELGPPSQRFLTLAGERALGLDTPQAEALLARALKLTPSEDPDRPGLIVRWADAAFQAGRAPEACEALEQVLDALRAGRDSETTAQALQLRSRISFRLADGKQVAFAVEAVELLEQGKPGPALIAAYSQLASSQTLAGHYDDAIVTADNARSLALSLSLPEPARALGYHGFSRAYLGEPDGLTDMEHALKLLVERGEGRDAAVLHNNLAIARYPLQGPARSLSAFEQAITFCEQRGLAESVGHLEANCPGLLIELGRPDEALARAKRLVGGFEASGDTNSLIEVCAVELATRLARGEEARPATVDWLIETARTIGGSDVFVLALAPAAAILVAQQPDRAGELLTELEQAPGSHQTPYYSRELASMVRTALAANDPELANRLADSLPARYPLDQHALHAARAHVAEHAGRHQHAADLYADAAERWHEFGNVPERAYALLGQGRCLLALDDAGAKLQLAEARDLFASMGYRPALAETETLLDLATQT